MSLSAIRVAARDHNRGQRHDDKTKTPIAMRLGTIAMRLVSWILPVTIQGPLMMIENRRCSSALDAPVQLA